jgi:hypothetical protein
MKTLVAVILEFRFWFDPRDMGEALRRVAPSRFVANAQDPTWLATNPLLATTGQVKTKR